MGDILKFGGSIAAIAAAGKALNVAKNRRKHASAEYRSLQASLLGFGQDSLVYICFTIACVS